MSLLGVLTAATVFLYFAGGAMGWAISIAAFGSRRYRPALSFAGAGIGLLPTYLGMLIILRQFGAIAEPDIWQRLASCLVTLAIMAAGFATLRLAVHARQREKADREAREAGGC